MWPVWLLAAATVFLAGFRIGLNVRASNVIDVGYSGVIGADRIVHGESPYGHFPSRGLAPAVRPGRQRRARSATASRRTASCETANPLGDTYGPVSYYAYIPGYLIFGWSHKWDTLPAVHFTSIAFDLLALLGLALVGRRFGGPRLGAAAAFAWAAWPFTQYASSSNTNDAIMPALLVWGFAALTSDAARGVAVALSGWTKFASLLVLPLWTGYPEARRLRPARRARSPPSPRRRSPSSSILLLEPSPLHAARDVLRPHRRLPVRPRLAVLDLGLAAVPRQGAARPRLVQRVSQGAARARCGRARARAAAPLAAAHGCAHAACCSSASSSS